MPRSLRLRLSLLTALTLSLALLGLVGLARIYLEHALNQAVDQHHRAEWAELGELLDTLPAPSMPVEELARRIASDVEADKHLFHFQLRNAAGEIVWRSRNLGPVALTPQERQQAPANYQDPVLGHLRLQSFPLGHHTLQIASSLAAEDRALEALTRIGLGATAAMALLAFGSAWLLIGFTLRPLRDIERTAEAIGSGGLATRIPEPRGADELANLARLLNRMFDRLEASFEQVRRFTADASHELRTPLAVLRLQGEQLLTQALPPGARQTIEDQLRGVQDLNRLVEDLLTLTRADGGVLPIERHPTDPQRFLEDLHEDLSLMAESRGRVLVLDPGPSCTVRLDPVWLRQAVWNLFANALKYSPPGGTITMRASVGEGGWQLSLTDEGPGVAAEHLQRIFERFVRAPGTQVEGSGLGLAIAQSILQLHQGAVRADNRTDRSGLIVTLHLPLA